MPPINTLEYAQIFQTALDEQLVAEAASGFLEENAGQVQYNGGNEIRVPKISLNGLGDYDRDNGFVQGSVTLAFETLTLGQDRGRTFQLDAQDVDETKFVANASNVMAQFQRTQVIPEIDAYRFSKIGAIAAAAGNVKAGYTPTTADVFQTLKNDILTLQDTIGAGYELVIVMSFPAAAELDLADKVQKNLLVTDFARGDITTKVTSIDGIPILKVQSKLLKTAYIFNDGATAGQTAGGFTPDAGAKQINWIVMARRSPIAISKTDVIRIFDPMSNQKANAWKIDYRKYHELWIPDNAVAGVRVNIAA